MSTKIFKMYGMQRTKTNYFQKILNLNFHDIIVLSNLSGWKHGLVQTSVDWSGDNWEETPEISKQYYMANMSESKGQSKLIDKAFKDKSVHFIFSYRNPYTNYMSREKHYHDKKRFIKDFISNCKRDVLDSFSNKFDLVPRSVPYNDVQTRLAPRMQNTNIKFVEPPPIQEVTIPEHVKDYFRSHIDHDLMLKLGYEVLM